MSDSNRGYTSPISARADMAVDAGLRGFMLGVYNKLALGLILSAGLAYASGFFPPVRDLFFAVSPDGVIAGITPLGHMLQFAPLVIIMISMFAMRNPTPQGAAALYWTMVSLIGLWLGVVMLIYTQTSVASTFLITATAFGALSLVGYTTKKDLTGFGNFLIMGLVGIVIAMIANYFMHLPGLEFIINILGVLIFAGLTAFHTQRLKLTYYQLGGDQAAMGVATSYGALTLYLDFINLFLFLLRFTGGGRR